MAPEQFVTGQSSVQSDVWALGVILYELVSGRHPFARPDAEDFQAIRAIQFSDPADLSEIVPDISTEPKRSRCFGNRAARGGGVHRDDGPDCSLRRAGFFTARVTRT